MQEHISHHLVGLKLSQPYRQSTPTVDRGSHRQQGRSHEYKQIDNYQILDNRRCLKISVHGQNYISYFQIRFRIPQPFRAKAQIKTVVRLAGRSPRMRRPAPFCRVCSAGCGPGVRWLFRNALALSLRRLHACGVPPPCRRSRQFH